VARIAAGHRRISAGFGRLDEALLAPAESVGNVVPIAAWG